MGETFDVDPADLAREVDACVKQLMDERLVEPKPSA
jgi:hypothetical protein